MMHLTYGDKSLLVDDESARLLVQFANLLGRMHTSDVITLQAIGVDGHHVEATFLLNTATSLVVETTTSELEAPDNTVAARYMRDRMDELANPATVKPGGLEPHATL